MVRNSPKITKDRNKQFTHEKSQQRVYTGKHSHLTNGRNRVKAGDASTQRTDGH